MKLTIAHVDVVWAAKLFRSTRHPWLATVDRGHCWGERGGCRDTGLALPIVALIDLKYQGRAFRDGVAHQAGLLTAVDRWLTGAVGGFATPRFLAIDVEAEAWHKAQVRRLWRTRSMLDGNGNTAHAYLRCAINGLRNWRDVVARRHDPAA